MNKTFMNLADALEIVSDLARENALDVDDCKKDGNLDLISEAKRQTIALDIVEYFMSLLTG